MPTSDYVPSIEDTALINPLTVHPHSYQFLPLEPPIDPTQMGVEVSGKGRTHEKIGDNRNSDTNMCDFPRNKRKWRNNYLLLIIVGALLICGLFFWVQCTDSNPLSNSLQDLNSVSVIPKVSPMLNQTCVNSSENKVCASFKLHLSAKNLSESDKYSSLRYVIGSYNRDVV